MLLRLLGLEVEKEFYEEMVKVVISHVVNFNGRLCCWMYEAR